MARLLAPLLGVGLALALVTAVWQWGKATEARAALSDFKADVAGKARTAEAAARVEEKRRIAAHQENTHVAKLANARAVADSRTAGLADGRLQHRVAAVAASCSRPAGDPAASPGGPAASAPGDLLADVSRRIGEAAGQLAEFAQLAHNAGLACQRDYGALTPPR